MRERAISTVKLGKLLGLSQGTAWSKLRGHTGWSYDDLVTLAEALDVTVAELVTPDPVNATPPESDS